MTSVFREFHDRYVFSRFTSDDDCYPMRPDDDFIFHALWWHISYAQCAGELEENADLWASWHKYVRVNHPDNFARASALFLEHFYEEATAYGFFIPSLQKKKSLDELFACRIVSVSDKFASQTAA